MVFLVVAYLLQLALTGIRRLALLATHVFADAFNGIVFNHMLSRWLSVVSVSGFTDYPKINTSR